MTLFKRKGGAYIGRHSVVRSDEAASLRAPSRNERELKRELSYSEVARMAGSLFCCCFVAGLLPDC